MSNLFEAVALSTLLPRVAVDAAGAPEALRRWALDGAYRLFVMQSRCWRERIVIEDIAGGVPGVPLLTSDAGARGQVARVRRLVLGERNVSAAAGWALVPYEDGQRYVRLDEALLPESVAANTWDLSADVVVWPATAATAGPDWIVEGFAEGIASGARARLKRLTRRPWSDPEGALFEEREYRREVARAAIEGQDAARWPASVVSLPAVPAALGWCVPEDETAVRELCEPGALTLAEFMQSFRTLVADLLERGVLS